MPTLIIKKKNTTKKKPEIAVRMEKLLILKTT